MAALSLKARKGEALDALLWRGLGRTADVTEAVLAANPGLAAVAHALPEGRVVVVPEAASVARATATLVQLWD